MSINAIPGLTSQRRSSHGKYNTAVVLLAVLAALVTFVAFLPALGNGFVNFDDPAYVFENPYIRSIDAAFFRWAAGAVVIGNWHPLTMLSYAADYALWGLDPRGFHLTNIVLHAINSALVMVVAVWITGLALTSGVRRLKTEEAYRTAIYTGLIASLLFGLHPLRVESVAWVAERKDVLCALFFLLSIITYLRYATTDEGKGRLAYAASLVFFTAALISKPMAITLPLVLIIVDLYPLERFFWEGKRVLVEKVPYLALSALSAAVTLWAQGSGGALGTIDAHPLATRLLVAVRAVAFYLYKTVWPLDLAPYYPYPARVELGNPEYAGAAILFIAITGVCLLTLKRTRLFSAVWAYFLVTLAPVAGLIQVGTQAAADRYTYLPGLAPTILVAALAALVIKEGGKKRLVGAAVVIVLIAFTSLTSAQIAVWKDSVGLWTYVVKYYEYTPEADMARIVAYYNRGKAYELMGKPGPALDDYDRVIVLSPGHVNAHVNRGALYARTGNLTRALWDFDSAVRLDPDDADALYNRGLARLALGETDKAIEDLQASARSRPGFTDVFTALAEAYTIAGDEEKALEAKEKALGLEAR